MSKLKDFIKIAGCAGWVVSASSDYVMMFDFPTQHSGYVMHIICVLQE